MKFEVCHMPSWSRRIMNQFKRFMKLIEHYDNIGWYVHELHCFLQLEWVGNSCGLKFSVDFIYFTLVVLKCLDCGGNLCH